MFSQCKIGQKVCAMGTHVYNLCRISEFTSGWPSIFWFILKTNTPPCSVSTQPWLISSNNLKDFTAACLGFLFKLLDDISLSKKSEIFAEGKKNVTHKLQKWRTYIRQVLQKNQMTPPLMLIPMIKSFVYHYAFHSYWVQCEAAKQGFKWDQISVVPSFLFL